MFRDMPLAEDARRLQRRSDGLDSGRLQVQMPIPATYFPVSLPDAYY